MKLDASILARIDAWIAAHPGYTRLGVDQPVQGHTNCICFVRGPGETDARRQLAVIKVFSDAERKARECFGMEHWQGTGLTPALIDDVDDTMIVISHVPGMMLHVSRALEGEPAWSEACRGAGYAAGKLTRVPLSASARQMFESSFYQGRQLSTLEGYLRYFYTAGRRICERNVGFGGAFWRGNLDFIASKIPAILHEEPVLCHMDAANLHVFGGWFQGFYDFEMCRVGCATVQLASSMRVAPEGWANFRDGWEAATGHALSLEERERAAAAAHLLDWLEINVRTLHVAGRPRAARPPKPDDSMASEETTPGQSGIELDAPDPHFYAARIERVRAMLDIPDAGGLVKRCE